MLEIVLLVFQFFLSRLTWIAILFQAAVAQLWQFSIARVILIVLATPLTIVLSLVLLILCLILVTLFLVLLVPVRYRGDFCFIQMPRGFSGLLPKKKDEQEVISQDPEALKFEIRFAWLFRLIRGHVIYQGQAIDWQIKVLNKSINLSEEEKLAKEQELKDKEERIAEKERLKRKRAKEKAKEMAKEKAKEAKASEAKSAKLDAKEGKAAKSQAAKYKAAGEQPAEKIVKSKLISELEEQDVEDKVEERKEAEVVKKAEVREKAETEEKAEAREKVETVEKVEARDRAAAKEAHEVKGFAKEELKKKRFKKEESENKEFSREESTEEEKRDFDDVVTGVFEKIEYTFAKIYDKINALLEKKEWLFNQLEDEINHRIVAKLWKETKRLLKSLRPKKITADMTFGFENPATTGYVLAGISVVYPHINKSAKFQADFEQEVLEGTVGIIGKIRIIHMIIFLSNIWLDPDCRKVIKEKVNKISKKVKK